MKILFTVLTATTLLACNQPQNKPADSSSTDTTSIEHDAPATDALKVYQRYLPTLDTSNVETATLAAKKYEELFPKEEASTRDKGFVLFNTYYERLERGVNGVHEKDTTDFDPLMMVDESGNRLPVPKKLKDYDDRLRRNGFQVGFTEGMSYIQQDRDFIAKWFYDYVSPQMKAYLQQLNKENKEGFQEDAGLTIEAKQYADRLVWWDNFIQNNNDFLFIAEAKEHRKYLLTYFLTGMDNTPLMDYGSTTLDDYYKTAYTYLQNSFPASETNRITNPYFKALMQNDNNKATALLTDYKKRGIIIDFEAGL